MTFGVKFDPSCPECGQINPAESQYCSECGYNFKPAKEPSNKTPETATQTFPSSKKESSSDVKPIAGERKHVTVLFSDLIGYTAMSEHLDPEDVKEITSRIFGEIAKIIDKYEGFVEKYIGDAVMAIFGAKKTHEDDPVRAIKAALEIHCEVNKISPQYEEIIEQPLSMHTGINTGLVVTGEINLEKGTHGVSGDTLNVAARLCGTGNSDEIIVGHDTYIQSEGYFDFKALEPANVKGKAEPIRVYKVLSIKGQPQKVHRLQGVRANLIGRKVELQQLNDGINRLQNREGLTISICGTAGTGKSRLVEEFKASLDLNKIQWLEGYAFPYAQNIPYFPLINLLNKALQIEEDDSPDKVREKIESGLRLLVGDAKGLIPYVGSLYSLDYPEINEVSPEFWKSHLQKAIEQILAALAKGGPTVICFEDLHWADPSFLDLFRHLLSSFKYNVLFLCIYRPTITLVSSQQTAAMLNPYIEIQIKDLSLSESHDMVESILQTDSIPPKLQKFIQNKVEGNPFYIEEVINSLIESKTLVQENGSWQVLKKISDAALSSTIHGVISSRLDRLENETKRILQEASVIGRAFYYEIIKKITDLKSGIEVHLSGLERLDFIKAKSFQPDIEYIFKHALTQEIVYSGLLKKDRQLIHERTGLVMEQLFKDRLPEFYETLAYHFRNGHSVIKAVNYLIQSGEKNIRRYAVNESHQYFKEAFDLLKNKQGSSINEDLLIIELLIKWSLVYYYRGDFKGLSNLLGEHKDIAESLDNKAKLGMFYAWYGFSLHAREKFKEAYSYLLKALELGKDIRDKKIIGYTSAWLSWTCTELGDLEEAIRFGERAQEICMNLSSDHYLYFKSLGGIGFASNFQGRSQKAFETGRALLEYGRKHSNVRSEVLGHTIIGLYHLNNGDLDSAIQSWNKGMKTAQDPFYYQFSKGYLGGGYFYNGQLEKSEKIFKEVAAYSEDFGCEVLGTPVISGIGAILMTKGQMSKGLKMIESALETCVQNERILRAAVIEHMLGKIYLQMVSKSGKTSLATVVKNIGFIVKNVPVATKKAETHFNNVLAIAKKKGAKGIEGQTYLDLGRLYRANGRNNQAKDNILKAAKVFKQCAAKNYLKQANEELRLLQ